MRSENVERAVGAQRGRLVDVDLEAPARRALSGEERCDAEILLAQHGEVVIGARDHRGDDDLGDVRALKPSILSSWSSHTAYSSPVRRGSVAIRQRARMLWVPSSAQVNSAKTTLVFPTSAASSMVGSPCLGDIASANDTFAAIRQAQPQGPVGFLEPGEGAREHGPSVSWTVRGDPCEWTAWPRKAWSVAPRP